MNKTSLVQTAEDSIYWFPWTGSDAQATLVLAAAVAQIPAEVCDIAIHVRCTREALHEFAVAYSQSPPSSDQLVANCPILPVRKFDRYLSEELYRLGLEHSMIDIPAAQQAAAFLSREIAGEPRGQDA